MDAFAEQHLFAPLGITNYEWDHINADMIHASGNLQLRPRDMAKFGVLYLNGGDVERAADRIPGVGRGLDAAPR